MKRTSRGFSLIELLVAISIFAILATASMPMIQDYTISSRLRDAGSALQADALFAKGEALKRRSSVTLAVTSTQVRVIDVANNTTLRQRDLPKQVVASVGDITFGSTGAPAEFGTSAQVDVSMSGVTCSSQYRCPRLVVDGGGEIRLYGNKLDTDK